MVGEKSVKYLFNQKYPNVGFSPFQLMKIRRNGKKN